MIELPKTWDSCLISDIGAVVGGGTPATKNPDYWGDEIPWISPSDLTGYKDIFIDRGAKSLSELGLSKCSARLVPAGSIHFSCRAPIGYVAISSESLCTNQGFKSLVLEEGVFNQYAYYYLRSIKGLANFVATGTTFREISSTAFRKLPFPLPPLNEQKRIVSKVEQLFSDLDDGEERLRLARRQLGVYRQSLLKQAFEGKLTATWRSQNPDLLESPDQLLARIQSEREARYEEKVEEWPSAIEKWEEAGKEGKKPSVPKKPAAIDPIKDSELNELAKLPRGWGWFRFGDIVSVRSGEGLTANMMREGDFPVYGGNGISGMHDEFRQIEPRLIIGRVGAKCGVVHITKPQSWVTDNALVTDFWIISADMKFFQLLFSFKDLNKQSVSTAQPVVSGAKLNPLPMQFPSLHEQREIVRQFTVIAQNEGAIDAALKRSESLRQSILKKAFSGQLVEQDPADEPAATLLARIRAERDAATATKSKKKSPKKKSATRKKLTGSSAKSRKASGNE